MELDLTDIPSIPPDLRDKEKDFAAALYLLQSVVRRTSPITEMVSHAIQLEYLSIGEPDPECPRMKYSYLPTPSGFDDIGINEMLRRAERILSGVTEKLWGELVKIEYQFRNK